MPFVPGSCRFSHLFPLFVDKFIFGCGLISFAKYDFKGLILRGMLTYFRKINPNDPSLENV